MDLDDSFISAQKEHFNMIAAEEPEAFVPFGKIILESQQSTAEKFSNDGEIFTLLSDDEPRSRDYTIFNELYQKDKTVVWSKGTGDSRNVIIAYTVENAIDQAFRMTFYEHLDRPNLPDYQRQDIPPGEKLDCVCIRTNDRLQTYATTGEQFVTWLPYQMTSMWPTKSGIIFERPPQTNSSIPASLWFSLIHPLEEMAPILLKNDPDSLQVLSVPTDDNKKIVFTNLDPSVCLTYNNETKTHSLWHVRTTSPEESCHINLCNTGDFFKDSSILCNQTSFHMNLSMSRSFAIAQTSSPFPPGSLANTMNKTKGKLETLRNISSPLNQQHTNPLATSNSLNARYSMTPSPRRKNKTSTSTRSQYFSHLSAPSTKLQLDDVSEPILSEICFDFVWSDKLGKSEPSGEASKGFVASDLLDRTYVCWLLKDIEVLRCVELKRLNDGKFFCCAPFSIPARDAVYVPALKLILTLDPGAETSMTLYSASIKVSKVHVPIVPGLASTGVSMSFQRLSLGSDQINLLSTPSSASRIRRFIPGIEGTSSPGFRPFNDSLTYSPIAPAAGGSSSLSFACFQGAVGLDLILTCSDGTHLRTRLPSLNSSPFTGACLRALRTALPDEVYVQAIAKFYCSRNAPGASNLTSEEEWAVFQSTLLQMMGFDHRDAAGMIGSPEVEFKKSRRSNEKGDDGDWEFLMENPNFLENSNKLSKLCHLPMDLPPKVKNLHEINQVNSTELLFGFSPQILFSLHLLYEDFKLRSTSWSHAKSLFGLLTRLAAAFSLEKYTDHYWRDFPELQEQSKTLSTRSADLSRFQAPLQQIEEPPSVYQFLANLMVSSNNGHLKTYPYVEAVNELSKQLITVYAILHGQAVDDKINLSSYLAVPEWTTENPNRTVRSLDSILLNGNKRGETAVLFMDSLQWTSSEIDSLAAGISLTIRGALLQCQREPGRNWADSAYVLVNRPDLMSQVPPEEATNSRTPEQLNLLTDAQREATSSSHEDEIDGMENLDSGLLALLFPDDLRMEDVRRLLCSSKPVSVAVTEVQGLSEHELLEKRERQLLTLSARTMSLSVGRGMFTLHTSRPVPTETIQIPKLCLTGKSATNGETVDLTHIEVAPNMALWPQFHNGVAAGLRISPTVDGIDSAWISYSKIQMGVTKELTPEFSGFLFGLGLTGHLTKLSDVLTHDYLSRDHEMTTLAILLGLGVARRGTQDPNTFRLISIHIESLTPPSTTNFDEAHNVRVAALLSLGFLYQGSGNLHITEVLLGEINRPPGPEMENFVDRESYSLAAGLALGLVNLGQGGDMTTVDWLHHYMVGGDKRSHAPASRLDGRNPAPSFLIREGNKVNVHVTSPSATLALGLMFLRTNNRIIASWMEVPRYQKLLDAIRPDFLMLRVLARGLILWDQVMPTKEWVESNIPDNIRTHCGHKPRDDEEHDVDYVTMYQTFYNVIAGAAMAIGFKFAGSANAEAFDTLFRYAKSVISLSGRSAAEWVGKSTLEACLSALVLSLSLVMAGTGELEVLRLCRYLRMRTGAQSSAVTYGSHMASHMALGFLFLGGGKLTLSTAPEAVAALVCACYPVFPIHSNDNRCHLQALRHLYVLGTESRLLIPREIPSGRQCYVHMEVTFINNQSCKLKAPCVLPELRFLNGVRIVDERYWPVTFERSNRTFNRLRDILNGHHELRIQLRVGRLSYLDDPDGFKSEIPLKSHRILYAKAEKILELTSDPYIQGLCDFYFNREPNQTITDPLLQNVALTLYDSVVEERTVMIRPWLRLLQPWMSSFDLWQRKFLFSLAEHEAADPTGCVFGGMANLLKKQTEMELAQKLVSCKQDLRMYMETGPCGETPKDIVDIVNFFQVPRMKNFGPEKFVSPFGFANELVAAGMNKRNAFQFAIYLWNR